MINSIMLGTTNVMIRYVEVQQVLVTEISMINSIMLGTTNVIIRYVEEQQDLVTEISHDKQYYVGHNKCYDHNRS